MDAGTPALPLYARFDGRFLLIVGEDGAAWRDVATDLAETSGIPLDIVIIGHTSGDYHDPRCMWLRRREISPRGPVLVRPDRYVAWRSMDRVGTPRAALSAALPKVLARHVD